MAESSGEARVAALLTMANFKFKQEYEFPDLVASSGRPLRMDFVVFDDDGSIAFAIEYQGEQHYRAVDYFGGKKGLQRQKYNDRKKALYCLDHGIPLVTIPYWDYDRLTIDYILEKANY